MQETIKAGKLLAQKLLIAFLAAFIPAFALSLLGALEALTDAVSKGGPIDFNFLGALLLSGALGAITAAVRAAFALLPGIQLTPSDKLHTLGKKNKPVVKAVPPT